MINPRFVRAAKVDFTQTSDKRSLPMDRTFAVQRGAVRVVFAAGAAKRIPEHLAPLSLKHVLVVSTKGRAAAATELARSLGGEVFASAREHVPGETVAEA